MKRALAPAAGHRNKTSAIAKEVDYGRGVIAVLLNLTVMIAALVQRAGLIDPSANQLLLLGVLVLVTFAKETWQRRSVELFGPASLVFYYLWFIGFGVPLAALVAPEAPEVLRVTTSVYYHNYLSLSLLASSGLALGAQRVQSRPSANGRLLKLEEAALSRLRVTGGRRLAVLGTSLIAVFTLYFVPLFLLGRVPTSYSMFKEWSSNRFFVYSRYGFWFGSIILACVGSPRQVRLGLLIGSLPATALLITGNRNDVLYPLLIAICVYSMRLGRRPWKSVGLVFVAIMTLGPIIARSREQGLGLADAGTSPMEAIADSLAELGAQARPVMMMFQWMANGEVYKLGGTYVLPTVSMMVQSFGDSVGEFGTSAYSLATRLPGLGFSMPGELYFNFGLIGVLLGYFITGRLLAGLESKAKANGMYLAYGFVSFTLLHLQRNSFGYFSVVIVLFLGVLALEKWTRLK